MTTKYKRGPETLYLNFFQHSFLIHKWRPTIIVIKYSLSLLTLVWSLETPLRCEHCIYFLTASMGKSIIHVLKIGGCAEMNRKTYRPRPHSCAIFCHKRALVFVCHCLLSPKQGTAWPSWTHWIIYHPVRVHLVKLKQMFAHQNMWIRYVSVQISTAFLHLFISTVEYLLQMKNKSAAFMVTWHRQSACHAWMAAFT